MRAPVYSGQFKRDARLAQKRGKDMAKFRTLATLLLAGESLPPRYKDHALRGEWIGFRDAHIEPDWVLIYKPSRVEVRFERMGTHADLFDE